MKIFREIFGRIWAVWGLAIFVITILIAFVFYAPCFFMKEPAASRWHKMVSIGWMNVFLNIAGCPLRVKGKEYFENGKNYVVVCNHNSLVDILLTTPFTPNINKTIARKDLARIPIFGWIYGAGSILVDRNDDKSRRKSFEQMKKVLALGLDMIIYPEGTRNRTDKPLKTFYDGAFKLAVDTGKPVMPVLIFNTTKVLPVKKTFFMWPHKLEMHFLPPSESSGIAPKALKEKIFEQMWNYYEANR